MADYDLVVTHNNVFRPAVVAIEAAKKHGVPSILIPHAHLDDDFYHFPDWLESARNASLVLAVPKAACDFLAEKGCNVRYLPAGCDAGEAFTPEDQEAFQQVHRSTRPFVLVLGRKAGAKGYRQIIDAVEQLNREGVDLQTVLIGPDDDGVRGEQSKRGLFWPPTAQRGPWCVAILCGAVQHEQQRKLRHRAAGSMVGGQAGDRQQELRGVS